MLACFGVQWTLQRALYSATSRLGLLERRSPCRAWEATQLAGYLTDGKLADPQAYLEYRQSVKPTFFWKGSEQGERAPRLRRYQRENINPELVVEELKRGRIRLFSNEWHQTGFPPDWHLNPSTGARIPADRHWSRVDEFGYGDVKFTWEVNRFHFAYAIVRAYWRTAREEDAELFWKAVEDWRDANPPNAGINWKCGQEISIRLMAWLFGLFGLMNAGSTTAGRVAMLSCMIAASAERISTNIDYAVRQRNNHGISEATGLWTVGLLFPEFRRAAEWREKGRRILESEARDLIYSDGAFAQHSLNYQRLILHNYCWAVRLGDLNGQPLSSGLRARLKCAAEFAYGLQDESSGKTVHYGHGDGSLILPLNNCDFDDFRPVIQMAHYLCTGTRCYPDGPWDEDLLWLFGVNAIGSTALSPRRENMVADDGGYYVLRSQTGFAFSRAAHLRHRPAHADMLHVDIWWRGRNVALDAGTYSYNAPRPWDNCFARTDSHNTVTVDGLDQMDRIGRFMWAPWIDGAVRASGCSPGGEISYWEAEHNGYCRIEPGLVHRRALVRMGADTWLILDALTSRKEREFRLHWLCPDYPHDWDPDSAELALSTGSGVYALQLSSVPGHAAFSVVSANPEGPRGWQSRYYGSRERALSVETVVRAPSVRFYSLWSPSGFRWTVSGEQVEIVGSEWKAHLQLSGRRAGTIAERIAMTGNVEDVLDVRSCKSC
jgi:hypothetical protein